MQKFINAVKKYVICYAVSVALGFAMAGAFCFFSLRSDSPPAVHSPAAVKLQSDYKAVAILDKDAQTTVYMPFSEYLTGVVAGEMPASFNEEALKAQAVAARTYAVYQIEGGGKHGDVADLCTDPTCCKAYCGEEELKERWGNEYEIFYSKIAKSVADTSNLIMVYDDEPICAVFHAMSGGMTENSSDVWGGELPYLVSVDSGYDAENKDFETQVRISQGEFYSVLEQNFPERFVSCDPADAIGPTVRSAGGGVKTITLCGVDLEGTKVRSLFSLRSANFEIKYEQGEFVFDVKGYGHGVGMSQRGAQGMAESGANFREILEHYYTGIEFAEMM